MSKIYVGNLRSLRIARVRLEALRAGADAMEAMYLDGRESIRRAADELGAAQFEVLLSCLLGEGASAHTFTVRVPIEGDDVPSAGICPGCSAVLNATVKARKKLGGMTPAERDAAVSRVAAEFQAELDNTIAGRELKP
jgi:hypothetical protein